MSGENTNSEDVCEREMRLCEDCRHHESADDVIISFNVSSGEMNIWFYYNKNWNAEGGTGKKKTCQYTSLCLKFNFDMYFYYVDYRIYDDSYGF